MNGGLEMITGGEAERPSLLQIELAVEELLKRQGFYRASLYDEAMDIQDAAARDGGLPLLVAQAVLWAEIAGLPNVNHACQIVPDSRALVNVRAVVATDPEGPPASYSVLLLAISHVVHVTRESVKGECLPLERLVTPPQSGVCNALSVRDWNALRPGPR